MTETDSSDVTAVTLGPGEGRQAPDPMGFPMTMKAWSGATLGAYAMAEMIKPPGIGPTPHIHPNAEELEPRHLLDISRHIHQSVPAGVRVIPELGIGCSPRPQSDCSRDGWKSTRRWLEVRLSGPPLE